MKKLFFANIVRVPDKVNDYQLDCEHEIYVGNNWDGDIRNFVNQKYSFYPHPEDIKFYDKFPYASSLDRKGIASDSELFVEFDDGDLCSITMYYLR